tara:strand:+ start:277 stop:582 length:306 start_codon:yes stop_codon:yes gene_type:complete
MPNMPKRPMFQQVDRYTRAGRYGRDIDCPKCLNSTRVYHFAWSSLLCGKCGEYIDKYRWTTTNIPGRVQKELARKNGEPLFPVSYYVEGLAKVTRNGIYPA